MQFNRQPTFIHERILLYPLEPDEFEQLYAAASDPAIWEQHPNHDRWKRDVFKVFFQGALESKGALKIVDPVTQEIIGSTRIYDHNEADSSVLIGYTFIARKYWGTGINSLVKSILLDYVFQFVNTVYFHIGANNIRSQKAIERIGAKKTGEAQVAYVGELPRLNFIYAIEKSYYTAGVTY